MPARRHRAPAYRTDWLRVIADLQRAGLSLSDLSEATEIPHPTLRAWRQGAEPGFEGGRLLLQMWINITGKTIEQRPMTWG